MSRNPLGMSQVVAHQDRTHAQSISSAVRVIAESCATGGVLRRQLNVLEFVYIRRLALRLNALRENADPTNPKDVRLALR